MTDENDKPAWAAGARKRYEAELAEGKEIRSAGGEPSAAPDAPSVGAAAAPPAETSLTSGPAPLVRGSNPREILQADTELTSEIMLLYRDALRDILREASGTSWVACPHCKRKVEVKKVDARAVNDSMRLWIEQVAGRVKEAPPDDRTGLDLQALRHLTVEERAQVRERLEAELAAL